MNGDIAHAAAYRRPEDGEQGRFLPGQRYCVRCSTYKPLEEISDRIGGYCWDCVHRPARRRAAAVTLRCISRGYRPAGLVVLALAVDAQLREEGLEAPSVAAQVRASERIEFQSRLRTMLIAARRATGTGQGNRRAERLEVAWVNRAPDAGVLL